MVAVVSWWFAGFLYVPRPIKCDNILAVDDWKDWKIEEDRLIQCCRPQFTR